MSKFKSLIVAVGGVAIVAAAAYAQPFGDHGGGSGWHYHGTSALAVCVAAAPEAVKTNLRSTFESSSIDADLQAVIAAKQALSRQILAKTADLTSYETALSNAERKVQQDKDAIAANICGQLSTKQLAAASTLYTNLQNDRAAVIGYFAAAHAAAE